VSLLMTAFNPMTLSKALSTYSAFSNENHIKRESLRLHYSLSFVSIYGFLHSEVTYSEVNKMFSSTNIVNGTVLNF
jgi:hypothetical protein